VLRFAQQRVSNGPIDKIAYTFCILFCIDLNYFLHLSLNIHLYIYIYSKERGRVVVMALRYNPEGRGFDTR
jgi:hypothetical protein